MSKFIGQPIPRVEDQRLVCGKGRYTDDIVFPDQLCAAFFRSPHPHAKIVAIDIEAAAAMPGVVAVLTGQDYLDDGFRGMDHVPNPADAIEFERRAFVESLTGSVFNQRHLPLPIDRVRHVGEAIVMVVAQTVRQARDAAEAVDVTFESLDAVVQADDALQEGAPQLWDGAPGNCCFQVQIGDREAARKIFESAHLVIRREFRNSRVVNCQMEPRSAIGSFDPQSGVYTLTSGSQGVTRQQLCIADALQVSPKLVRVISPDVGGGFGPRSSVNPEQLAVLWAARRVGQPVKWTSDRGEAFLSDYQGRDVLIQAAFAFAEDGRILAIDNEMIGNVGAHTVSYVPMSNGSRVMTTVYDVPVAAVHITGAMTNTAPTAPYRGAGRPEVTHVMERMLDIAAGELGIDRLDIRRRNIIERSRLPFRSPMGLNYDSGDFLGNMERAIVVSEWDSVDERRREARSRGRLLGIGLANYVESPVGAPRERVELTVLPDGRVDVVAGTQSTGQGHETSFAQVIADKLGVPMESICLRTGDTAFVKLGGGTHSDRSMRLVSMLLLQITSSIIDIGKPVASELLDAPAGSLSFVDGVYVDGGSGRQVGLFEVAARIAANGLPADPSKKTLEFAAEFNGRIAAHPTGSAICELEIDTETGHVFIVRYTSIDDVGMPVNPLIVEGQVHGGLAQGLGQALYEGFEVDRATGQVLSGSYMDYGVTRAENMPPLRIELTEDPTSGNPLGIKGGGESGITPATATVFNALADALGNITTHELPMPATASAIWELLQQSEGAAVD